jgi:hypothetical protein
MATARTTTDHDEIRRWAEARGGSPARVKATGGGDDPGILRIDFPGFSGEDTLEEISWDEFFEWFDRNKLAALLSTARKNRFSKLVDRGNVSTSSKKSSSKKASSKKRSTSVKRASTTKKASSKKSSSKKSSSKKRSTSTKKSPARKSTSKKASSKKSASRKPASKKSASKKSASRKATAKKSSSKKSTASRVARAVRFALGAVSTKGAKKTTSRKKSAKKSGGTSGSAVTTTDRDEIRNWVEQRGGFPAHVKRTGSRAGDPGVLRIDYPGYSGRDTLERISWDEWFDAFEKNKLGFLYQPKKNSRFSKLVAR